MFSACASSQVSSVDSYTTGFGEDERTSIHHGMEDLLAEFADSLPEDESSVDGDKGSSGYSDASSHNSILKNLSFSSDTETESHPVDTRKYSEKSEKKVSQQTEVECVIQPGSVAKIAQTSAKKKARGRTRSPMGTYIPPPGGKPLARAFFSSPGPAAYAPNYKVAKPSPPEYLLKFRPKMPLVQSYGPGPAAYDITTPCCPDTYQPMHLSKRFVDSETIGPGPAQEPLNERPYYDTGKFKPKAVIISRPRVKPPETQDAEMADLFGWTRYGRYHIPGIVITGCPICVKVPSPGPGAYDPDRCRRWCKPGIAIRGRPKFSPLTSSPGPDYGPPSTLQGPCFILTGRHFDKIGSQSPGPIYDIPPDPKKPVSMIFKPFPTKWAAEIPGPGQYPQAGDQHIYVKPRAPRALIVSQNAPPDKRALIPGPNQYSPPDRICFSCYNKCSMKGHRSNKVQNPTPGPADYNVPSIPPHLRRSTAAVIPRGTLKGCVCKSTPGYLNPKLDKGTTRNVILASRHQPRKVMTQDVPFYDLTGFTMKGKSNPKAISLKSRQSPFVYQGISSNAKAILDTCNLKSLKYERPSVTGVASTAIKTHQAKTAC